MAKAETVEELISALASGDSYSMMKAASDLGNCGECAVDPLIRLMQDPARDMQWKAAIALERVGRPALGPLVQALKAEEKDTREAAIWALEQIKDENAVDPLIEVLTCDNHDFCRWMAAAALKKIGSRKALDAVEEALRDEDEKVRGYIGDLVYGT